MIFEVDETQNEKYRPALLNLEMRTGLKGGRLIRYTKDHPTHKNQFRYRIKPAGLDSKVVKMEKGVLIESNKFSEDSYLHDHPQYGSGDFLAPLGSPVSIFNTETKTFTVHRITPNVTGGNIVEISFVPKGFRQVKVLKFFHLANEFPDYVLDGLKKFKDMVSPVTLFCGTPFGFIGATGNSGIWLQGGEFSDPTPHTHISNLPIENNRLVDWCKPVLSIDGNVEIKVKKGW